MWDFLIGMIVGSAIGVLGYMYGHSTATRYWKTAVDSLQAAKLRLEDDLTRLKNKLP
jgi:hypothetical protein